MLDNRLLKFVVKKVLERANCYEWELKGLGLMRTYLTEDTKLHVWDERYRIPKVSRIHEHPWSFRSHVIAGTVKQYRFYQNESGSSYFRSIVQCGPGGLLKGNLEKVKLCRQPLEIHCEGKWYQQNMYEVHMSLPSPGTVTLVERLDYLPERAANVYWEEGSNWVSSEPAIATPEQVEDIAQRSLQLWF